jgi:hypothetical protein
MAKALNREQAERKKSQAARFMERIGQPDRADDFDRMSVDDYAEGKGRSLSNPVTRERNRTTMANGATTTTKADLQDQIDSAISTLEDAYVPESTREELAEAISDALDTLRGEEDEDEDLDGDDDGNGDDLD